MLQQQTHYTREQYLKYAENATTKHEFYQGEIFAMSGGTFNHAAIAGNTYAALKTQLKGQPCQPMNSDMRVHSPLEFDTYPDVSLYCGMPELTDNQQTLLNPIIIFEVLSPSTANDDRGNKFNLYRAIPTLQDYVLIDSSQIGVEHFYRAGAGQWTLSEYKVVDEHLLLHSIDVALSLASLYEGVNFKSQASVRR